MSKHPAHLAAALGLLLAIGGAPAIAQEEEDNEWPIELTAERGTVIIYQPQPESFKGDMLEARAAVAVKMSGQEAPTFGAIWLRARMATDLDARTVTCESLEVTAAKFPDVSEDNVDALSRFV